MSISAFGVDHGEIYKGYAEARQRASQKKQSVAGQSAGLAGAGLAGAIAGPAIHGVKFNNKTLRNARAAGQHVPKAAAGAWRTGGAIGGGAAGLIKRPGLAAGATVGGAIMGGVMAHAHNEKIKKSIGTKTIKNVAMLGGAGAVGGGAIGAGSGYVSGRTGSSNRRQSKKMGNVGGAVVGAGAGLLGAGPIGAVGGALGGGYLGGKAAQAGATHRINARKQRT